MGKTFKDQKNYPRYKKAKQKPFSKDYLEAKRGEGELELELEFLSVFDEGGVHCAYCGGGAEHERGFLRCEECGLSDAGPDFNFKVAA